MFVLNIEGCRSISNLVRNGILELPVVASFNSNEAECPIGKGRMSADILNVHNNGSTQIDVRVQCRDCRLCRKQIFVAKWIPNTTS